MKHVLKILTLDQLLAILPISAKIGLSEDEVIFEVKKTLKKMDSEQRQKQIEIAKELVNKFISEAKKRFREENKGLINEDVFNKIFSTRLKECLIENNLDLAIRIWEDKMGDLGYYDRQSFMYSIDIDFAQLTEKLKTLK